MATARLIQLFATVWKKKCIAHITKRIDTGQQTIVKNNKGNNSSLAFLYQILIYFKSTSSFSTP